MPGGNAAEFQAVRVVRKLLLQAASTVKPPALPRGPGNPFFARDSHSFLLAAVDKAACILARLRMSFQHCSQKRAAPITRPPSFVSASFRWIGFGSSQSEHSMYGCALMVFLRGVVVICLSACIKHSSRSQPASGCTRLRLRAPKGGSAGLRVLPAGSDLARLIDAYYGCDRPVVWDRVPWNHQLLHQDAADLGVVLDPDCESRRCVCSALLGVRHLGSS
jgi:hypothetical protein